MNNYVDFPVKEVTTLHIIVSVSDKQYYPECYNNSKIFIVFVRLRIQAYM